MKVKSFLFVSLVACGVCCVQNVSADTGATIAHGVELRNQIFCQRAVQLLLPEIIENPKSEEEFDRNIKIYSHLELCGEEYRIRASIEQDMKWLLKSI